MTNHEANLAILKLLQDYVKTYDVRFGQAVDFFQLDERRYNESSEETLKDMKARLTLINY